MVSAPGFFIYTVPFHGTELLALFFPLKKPGQKLISGSSAGSVRDKIKGWKREGKKGDMNAITKKAPKSNRHLASPGSFGSDWFGARFNGETSVKAQSLTNTQIG
jgi:hypothetical protein